MILLIFKHEHSLLQVDLEALHRQKDARCRFLGSWSVALVLMVLFDCHFRVRMVLRSEVAAEAYSQRILLLVDALLDLAYNQGHGPLLSLVRALLLRNGKSGILNFLLNILWNRGLFWH